MSSKSPSRKRLTTPSPDAAAKYELSFEMATWKTSPPLTSSLRSVPDSGPIPNTRSFPSSPPHRTVWLSAAQEIERM
jgi:hypothetical protein